VNETKKGASAMNRKTITLAMSLFLSFFLGGVGCSTLPRPEVTGPGLLDVRGAALASGPAFVHISTGGEGTATLYLADDARDGSTVCPSATAEQATALRVLDGDSHVSDLPVPGGKRICAAFDSPSISMTWLAEDYSPDNRARRPAGPEPTIMMLAKR
jgi:hypothetical protein